MNSSTSISESDGRRQRLFLALFLIPLSITFGVSLLVLVISHEFFTTKAGLAKQMRTGGVYGRTIFADDHHYKVLLYKQLQPRILAMGSSRTMQFRASFFPPGERFMTAGGAMHNLAEGRRFIEETFPEHHPDIVILGVDYWWLNEQSGDEGSVKVGDARYDSYSYVLAAGVGSLRRLLPHLILRARPEPPFSSAGAVGSRGWAYGDGFRVDGSYAASVYYNHFSTEDSLLDPDYRNTLRRIHDETHPFEGGGEVSVRQLAALVELIDTVHNFGAIPVLFLPPFSPAVFRALQASPRHSVFREVRDRMVALARERAVVFRDESLMPVEDRRCYMDGFHASEHLYALITSRLIPKERTDPVELTRLISDIGRGCPVMMGLPPSASMAGKR